MFYSIVLCTDDESVEKAYRKLETKFKDKVGHDEDRCVCLVRRCRAYINLRLVCSVDVCEDFRGETRDVHKRMVHALWRACLRALTATCAGSQGSIQHGRLHLQGAL
jgi:hypothetical protein